MNTLECKRAGCGVATGGNCLEGFDPPQTCPYLSSPEAASRDPSQSTAYIDLPAGEALSELDACTVTRDGRTQVVIIAGPVQSGKTTILTSLYEAFLEAPFGDYLFGGSHTMVGFERRRHDARLHPREGRRETARTPISALAEFLHLRLFHAREAPSSAQNLLLSDISGERFRTLRDSSAAIQDMRALHRADHFCVVIDGEKLIQPDHRFSARADARTLLRSVLEARVLRPTCRLQVAFTKWDVVVAHPDKKQIAAFVNDTKTALRQVAGQDAPLDFFEVAARPEGPSLPFAYGLPTLLRSWMQDASKQGLPRLFLPSDTAQAREISRLAQSVAKSQQLGNTYDIHWI